jgi:ribosomal protein S27AE
MRYTCAKCANTFDAPELNPYSYGKFLMRSSSGSTVYLDALQDDTYKEIDNFLLSQEKIRSLNDNDRSEILQRIYGIIACDRDKDGNYFVIGAHPACPNCGAQEMASWEFKQPPEIIDIMIPNVTHKYWSSLNKQEKEAIILNKI